jgi:hypothetical protein
MLSNLRRFTACALVGAGALVFLGGCEDQQARADATKAVNEVAALKSELAAATVNAEKIKSEMKALNDELSARVTGKLNELQKAMETKASDEVERLKAEYKKNVDIAATNAAETERISAAKKTVDNKPEIMETIRLLREETQKNNDLMQKYIDNQLKELYPYAYQPRRLDPNAGPGEAVK